MTLLCLKHRSFPLHFDENSFFAGDKNEAHKLKVIILQPVEYAGVSGRSRIPGRGCGERWIGMGAWSEHWLSTGEALVAFCSRGCLINRYALCVQNSYK